MFLLPLGYVNLINVSPLSAWMPQIFVFVFVFREQLWKKRNGHGIAGHLPAWLNKFIAHWERRLLQNAANVAQLPVQSVCVLVWVCLPYNWHSKRGRHRGGVERRWGRGYGADKRFHSWIHMYLIDTTSSVASTWAASIVRHCHKWDFSLCDFSRRA